MRARLSEAQRDRLFDYIQKASSSLNGALRDPSNGPTGALMLLSSILSNAIGPLDQAEWEGLRKAAAEPCDQPDCICHLFLSELFDALDKMRDDWIEQIAKARGT